MTDRITLRELLEKGSDIGLLREMIGFVAERLMALEVEGRGMGPSDAQRLKSLEEENRRLKKLLAELMLDVAALKDLLAKN